LFLKKERNSAFFLMMLCLVAMLTGGTLYSIPAHAAAPEENYKVKIRDDFPTIINPSDGAICPIEEYTGTAQMQQNRNRYGIVKRMVKCVQGLIIPATYMMMYDFSVNYIHKTIAAAMSVAVVLWGILAVLGKNTAIVREAFTVGIKLGAVSFFTYVLGKSSFWPDGLFPVMIDIVDWLASIVSQYIGYTSSIKCAVNLHPLDIWGRVDCALNSLLGGIFDPQMLIMGLAGFFLSCITSGTFGLFLALAGFAIIFFLVTSIFRACYIAITAYVALALMAIISPIFITMVLFKSTSSYFEKWLKLTIGFMLQPLFLFAYISMMLLAFDTVVYDGKFSVYRAIVPAQVIGTYPAPLKPYPPENPTTNPNGEFFIGKWLFDMNIYRDTTTTGVGVGLNPRLDATQQAADVGLGGSIGERPIDTDSFERRDAAGLAISVLDSFKTMDVQPVNLPMKKISWYNLAVMHECGGDSSRCPISQRGKLIEKDYCDKAPNNCTEKERKALADNYLNITIDYMIKLLLSLLIAVLTMHIFRNLLDVLPFVGAGIGGEKESMPTLGANGMQMPGSQAIEKIKSQMGRLTGGG